MHAAALAVTVALTLVASSAAAEPDRATPSRQDVQQARSAAADRARDVVAVQADLVLANQRLQQSAVRAAQAVEAWNGARYRFAQARQAAAAAERRSELAAVDLEQQRVAYADAITTSYELGPSLTTFGAMVEADGIATVLQRTTTVANATKALDQTYDEFTATVTIADVATDQAREARAEARDLRAQARQARDAARGAAEAAAAEASAIAEEKDRLIAELAELQQISHTLAQRRQSALEAKAAAAAAAAAAQAATAAASHQEKEEEKEKHTGSDQGPNPASSHQHSPGPTSGGTPDPATPAPTLAPTPNPTPNPTPPAPAGGASSAIAFARSHVGDPYRWGAAGPGAWDCSGLTMGAWRAGGKSLPHYSVAQYEQSTPISAASLRPGDLVFWGSSSSPSSIYHVALYVGGGDIVHAPRTGRPVTEESMYYWTPPTFYARP